MTDRSEIPAIARQAAALITNSEWGRRAWYSFLVMGLSFATIWLAGYGAAKQGLSESLAKTIVMNAYWALALNGLWVMVAPTAEQVIKMIAQATAAVQAIRLGKTPPPPAA